MGMEWADDLGWGLGDEESVFRYVQQQVSMDHAYVVFGGHLEPEGWQERAYTQNGDGWAQRWELNAELQTPFQN